MSKVTLRTIAEAAGTSVPTVSLALSDHPRVNNETKKRVLQLCVDLGYRSRAELRQQRQRRELRSIRRFTFVAIGPNARQNVSSRLVAELMTDPLESRARIEIMAIESESRDDVADQISACDSEGFILYGRIDWALLLRLQASARPFVVVGPVVGQQPVDTGDMRVISVDVNAIDIACQATTLLLEAGWRRIFLATAGGVPGLFYDRFMDGYRMALMRAGLTPDDRLVDRAAGRTLLEGDATLAATISTPGTAFLTPCPDIANRLRTALQRQGLDLTPDRSFLCTVEGLAEAAGLTALPRIAIPEQRLSQRCVDALHELQNRRRTGFEQVHLPFAVLNRAALAAPVETS
jgi:DNA-binding LacI/PurR family transcriptional regulator